MSTPCPRDAAWQALMFANQGVCTLQESLRKWHGEKTPSAKDFSLAQEIAYGVQKRILTLDHLAKELAHPEKLKLKAKEKMVLRIALYQSYFLDRIPLYAIVDESVRLAKRRCHSRFAQFLNALLRRLEHKIPPLPTKSCTLDDLSISYSYSLYFLQELQKRYSLEALKDLLQAMNDTPKLMARERLQKPLSMRTFTSEEREEIAKSKHYYIQNITQAHHLSELVNHTKPPATILDLCSAPGGKLIATSEHFPHAKLFANDISEKRLERLRENLTKYDLAIPITCHPAQEFPEDNKYDLIILDVPCTNSGVLHKRPEARWKISKESLLQLENLQFSLLQKAQRLLAPQGSIWYFTCSILPQENEKMIERIQKELSLKVSGTPLLQLPNTQGWDGGFACMLTM